MNLLSLRSHERSRRGHERSRKSHIAGRRSCHKGSCRKSHVASCRRSHVLSCRRNHVASRRSLVLLVAMPAKESVSLKSNHLHVCLEDLHRMMTRECSRTITINTHLLHQSLRSLSVSMLQTQVSLLCIVARVFPKHRQQTCIILGEECRNLVVDRLLLQLVEFSIDKGGKVVSSGVGLVGLVLEVADCRDGRLMPCEGGL